MDAISFSKAAKQETRIKNLIADPDSTSGIVTVPMKIELGESITIPAGRMAILPNLQVDGTLNIEGEVFVPSGATFDDLETQIAAKADKATTLAGYGITDAYTKSEAAGGVRQTVQYASTDANGLPTFLATAGTVDMSNTHDVFADGSIVATYPLNGNANDLGGNYNGTASGVTYSTGKFGQCAVFNGSAYITKAVTYKSLSLWVKFTSLPNANQVISDNRNIVGDTFYGIQVMSNNTISAVGGTLYINGVSTADVAYTVIANEWIHIALVSNTNLTNLVLGGRFVLDQLFLNSASMDQVRVFNRALTQAEVTTLYTETKPVAGLNVGVLASTIPVKISAAGGLVDRTAVLTGDASITGLSANAVNYLYADINADNNVTFGSTVYAPEYRIGLPSTDFPTWDTVNKGSGVSLSNGNLTATKVVTSSWANSNVYASKLVKDGKFYAEVTVGAFASAGYLNIGVSTINTKQNDTFPYATTGYSYLDSGTKTTNSVSTAYGASYTAGDVIGVLFDYATGQLTFYKNGVSQGVAYTLAVGTPVYLAVSQYSTGNVTVNYGASAFTYPLPSGAVAWNAERVVGKHVFSIPTMEMNVVNGVGYDKKSRVFLGEATTDASAITSLITYALNGKYDSGWINTLPASATIISKNSNLGVETINRQISFKCLTAEQGYSVGDIIDMTASGSGGYPMSFNLTTTRNTVGFTSGSYSSNGFNITNKATGTNTNSPTIAYWAYKITVKRGW